MLAFLALVTAQALYTVSDAWKKWIFATRGFNAAAFFRPAFLAAMLIVLAGFIFHMYALSRLGLARTTVTLGLSAVVMSSAAGMLVFKETFSPVNWLGLALACVAVLLVNVK